MMLWNDVVTDKILLLSILKQCCHQKNPGTEFSWQKTYPIKIQFSKIIKDIKIGKEKKWKNPADIAQKCLLAIDLIASLLSAKKQELFSNCEFTFKWKKEKKEGVK